MRHADMILKVWWRVEDGDVFCEEGWARVSSPDWFYFFAPEDSRWPEEVDPSFHVDDLFEEEAPAVAAAIKYHEKQIFDSQLKLARLRGTNMVG